MGRLTPSPEGKSKVSLARPIGLTGRYHGYNHLSALHHSPMMTMNRLQAFLGSKSEKLQTGSACKILSTTFKYVWKINIIGVFLS